MSQKLLCVRLAREYDANGPGYRVYYGRDGHNIVILLAGGTKKRQDRDIEQARIHWKAYKQEKRNARKRT